MSRKELARREAAGAVLRVVISRRSGFSRRSEFYLQQLRIVRRRIAAWHLTVDDLRAARPVSVLQAADLTEAEFHAIMADLAKAQ